MFSFNELRSVHLEITNQCQASCPMCARNNHGALANPLLVDQSWTLGDFTTIFNQEVLNTVRFIYFCGNFGDPILNPNLPAMCLYLKKQMPSVRVHIHTNGGARNSAWWKELAKSLPEDHLVVFGIDGLEDTHHLYRIGTTYDNVIKNASTFINEGGNAEWCFIKFKHNQHQEDEARSRAVKLGFKQFTLKNSSRFLGEPKYPVWDKSGYTTHIIEPPEDNKVHFISKSMIESYKQTIMPLEIKCKVQRSKELYIDAYKNIFPCCWVASIPYTEYDNENVNLGIRQEIKKQYDDLVDYFGGIEQLSAIQVGIKNVLDSSTWQSAWEIYWNQKKLIMCARICGDTKLISQPDDQFIKREKLQQ